MSPFQRKSTQTAANTSFFSGDEKSLNSVRSENLRLELKQELFNWKKKFVAQAQDEFDQHWLVPDLWTGQRIYLSSFIMLWKNLETLTVEPGDSRNGAAILESGIRTRSGFSGNPDREVSRPELGSHHWAERWPDRSWEPRHEAEEQHQHQQQQQQPRSWSQPSQQPQQHQQQPSWHKTLLDHFIQFRLAWRVNFFASIKFIIA